MEFIIGGLSLAIIALVWQDRKAMRRLLAAECASIGWHMAVRGETEAAACRRVLAVMDNAKLTRLPGASAGYETQNKED